MPGYSKKKSIRVLTRSFPSTCRRSSTWPFARAAQRSFSFSISSQFRRSSLFLFFVALSTIVFSVLQNIHRAGRTCWFCWFDFTVCDVGSALLSFFTREGESSDVVTVFAMLSVSVAFRSSCCILQVNDSILRIRRRKDPFKGYWKKYIYKIVRQIE